jgi:hypothetical protein
MNRWKEVWLKQEIECMSWWMEVKKVERLQVNLPTWRWEEGTLSNSREMKRM